MSHLTKVRMEIKRLDILKGVLRGMGLHLDETNKTLQGRYIGSVNCEGVITRKGEKATMTNSAGLQKNPNGSYQIVMDNYGNDLTREAGRDCSGVTRGYAEQLAKNEMANAGYMLHDQSIDQKTGDMVLQFSSLN